jgi:hypothetical protein
MPFNRESEDDDDLFDRVTDMADRMGLQGEKRATYIDDHMTQGGYSRVQSRESYARQSQEDESQGDGNRWGFGGGKGSGQSRRNPSRTRGNEDDSF